MAEKNDSSDKLLTFSTVIAYLIPGFIALWGLSSPYPEIKAWLFAPAGDTSLGTFLTVTVASLALGVFVSAVRWFIVDHIMGWIGVRPPDLDFSKLAGKLQEFQAVVENHYKYYQCYANTLIALVFCLVLMQELTLSWAFTNWKSACCFAALIFMLFLAARDSLKKYFNRSKDVLGIKK